MTRLLNFLGFATVIAAIIVGLLQLDLSPSVRAAVILVCHKSSQAEANSCPHLLALRSQQQHIHVRSRQFHLIRVLMCLQAPFGGIVLFGVYLLATLAHGVANFKNCPQEAENLQKVGHLSL